MSYAGLILTFVFVDNLALSQLLGMCTLLGTPRFPGPTLRLGLSVALLLPPFALCCWALQARVLIPLGLGGLQLIAFCLVLALLLLALGVRARGRSRAAGGRPDRGLGLYLPHAVSSCAVLGIGLQVTRAGGSAAASLVAGAAAGAGFLLAVTVMSGLREKLDMEGVPRPLRGLPIALLTAGLMAMAFLAFDEALLKNLLG